MSPELTTALILGGATVVASLVAAASAFMGARHSSQVRKDLGHPNGYKTVAFMLEDVLGRLERIEMQTADQENRLVAHDGRLDAHQGDLERHEADLHPERN